MGGSNSKLQGLKIDRERWSKMESKGQYDVMWDKKGEEAQLYKFILDETMEIDNEINNNSYRAKVQGNHVRVIGAQNTEEKIGLCGKQKNVEVLTQRIPTLLCDSRQLNLQQANIVLYNALKGYSKLSEKFGHVEVTDKMIGFNSDGRTKVWINENFGRNHPSNLRQKQVTDLTTLKQNNNQQQMVLNIINIVERKCEKGQFPEPYRTNIYRNNNLTFKGTTEWIQNTQILPLAALEENKILLNRIIEPVNPVPYRPSVPIPPPATHNPTAMTNTRVSFNYISPTSFK